MSQQSTQTFRVAVIPVTGFQQNCSLVYDTVSKRGAVVDPGGDVEMIMEAIGKMGLTIEKILLTHGHIDHAGGAAELREKLGVTIEGPHEADKYLLDNLPQSGARYGMLTAREVTPDRWLKDGDEVEVAGFRFAIIHAPGHSPGSVVFFNAANRFALMGDVLFQGSIGRTDLPGGSHETLLDSIEEKVLPLGDDVVFLPGHGNASSIGDERQSNPFLRR
ncbi:MBL fold metallo-hydrolase [Aestuariivirga sp.]|uniref:MBL fold metallo-hydrolase n=1 Tax=Aestuariivirga sp. TaxID=2650926 RepID=UPI0039E5C3D5